MRRGAAAAVALAGLAAASAAWLNGWPGGGTSERPLQGDDGMLASGV